MSITSEKIDLIIKAGLHPALKKMGFQRNAHTFRRARENCIQLINVQGSWTNFQDQGQFTINLGVYFQEAARIHGLYRVTNRPVISDCMVHERIGNLMPDLRDFWWKFDSQSDFDELGKQVTTSCLDYGILWLEKYATTEGAISYAQGKGIPYWAAVFSIIQGDLENAEKYLVAAIEKNAANLRHKSYLESWGRAYGLIR